jgi:acetylglutamate synthase
VDFSKLDEEVPKLRHIYNEAWKDNWGFVPFTDDEFEVLVKELKMITTPKLVFVVEDNGEPVAFSATIPNINEIFIKIRNGKLFPFNFLKLINFKKRVKTVRILTLGILEKYRKTGIDAVMYARTFENGTKLGYYEGEASWILENNTMMNRALKNINAELYKTYRIYQYKF